MQKYRILPPKSGRKKTRARQLSFLEPIRFFKLGLGTGVVGGRETRWEGEGGEGRIVAIKVLVADLLNAPRRPTLTHAAMDARSRHAHAARVPLARPS